MALESSKVAEEHPRKVATGALSDRDASPASLSQSLVSADSEAHEAVGRETDRFTEYLAAGRSARLIRRAPATTQLLIPYIVLILPQAILNENPDVFFIIGVLGLALLGTSLVEILMRPISVDGNIERSRRAFANHDSTLRTVAIVACLTGQLSGVVSALMGGGTVASQVGVARPASSLVPVLTMFTSWSYSGAALIIGAYLAGQCSKRTLHCVFLVMVALECVHVLSTLITASLISLVVYLVFLLLFVGTLRIRHCLVAVIVVMLAWPTAFALRNELRRDAGVSVSSSVSAYDRLRYDLQITRAADLPTEVDLGQPGIAGVLRYGLVPRVLDSGRPELATGKRINAYLGGLDTSSYNFLPVTTLYVLEGPRNTVLFYAAIALALFFVIHWGTLISPLRLVIFGLISYGPLGWFAAFPDSSVGSLQGLVAAIPLLVIVWLGSRKPLRTSYR